MCWYRRSRSRLHCAPSEMPVRADQHPTPSTASYDVASPGSSPAPIALPLTSAENAVFDNCPSTSVSSDSPKETPKRQGWYRATSSSTPQLILTNDPTEPPTEPDRAVFGEPNSPRYTCCRMSAYSASSRAHFSPNISLERIPASTASFAINCSRTSSVENSNLTSFLIEESLQPISGKTDQ